MSEIKVNTITKRTGSTLTIGESGTTVTLAQVQVNRVLKHRLAISSNKFIYSRS